MDWDKMLEFWGPEMLNRWTPEVLEHMRIGPMSKSFLEKVGLPRELGPTLRFGQLDIKSMELPNYDGYYIIGYDDPMPICIEGYDTDHVITYDNTNGSYTHLNSSVEQLGFCLMYYEQCRRARAEVTEDQDVGIIVKMQRKMKRVDPNAFTDSGMGWPEIIEQMRYGFL